MSAANCLLTEDQFLCSICLDVFTDPVTIPCGHNFCKACIRKHWKRNVSRRCPNCNKVFSTRPELLVNTFISEMAAQFRASAQQEASSSSSEQQAAEPGEAKQTTAKVPFYIFSGTKLNALMFCLVCPICVCMLYAVLVNKTHDVVPLTEEYVEKMVELKKTEAKILQMIQTRQMKIQEMRRSVELSNEGADREIAAVKEKQRETEKQAEGFIKELEQEISELEKRSTEVEQLSQSDINTALPTNDWTGISIRPSSYGGTVRRALQQLEEKLSEQMKNLLELKRVQQYAVDVTLDLDTEDPFLIMSYDGKQVKDNDACQNLPHNPERFDTTAALVVSKQSFSSGRFYYEVQVEGKTHWHLGVVRESINDEGQITLSPQNGCWTIWLRNGNEYLALAGPAVRLSLKSRPQKVGVFVDYEEGLVSFYDVDAAALIYSYTGCSFTEKLYPFFCPGPHDGGKNSAPLIISPVNHAE